MKTAIDRLRQFIESQTISERNFFEQSGLPPGSFSKIKSIGSENLKKISNAFPTLNIQWVVTGRGKMLVENEVLNVVNEPQEPYGVNYKEKYFEVLEKYNKCLEQQNSKEKTA